jgi:hypothetical protein
VRWERIYVYPGCAPLSIASMKLAAPDGSLLEVTRGGIGMRLALSVAEVALVFRSTGYFLRVGGWLVPLPMLLTPARCTSSSASSSPARPWSARSTGRRRRCA